MTVTIRFKHNGKHRPKDRVYKDVTDINKAYVNGTIYYCVMFKNQQICIPSSEVFTIQKVKG